MNKVALNRGHENTVDKGKKSNEYMNLINHTCCCTFDASMSI